MEVSFHGFKNAGVERLGVYRGIFPVGQFRVFNCELTNTGEKDLDAFSSLIKKSANKINKNFLNLVLYKYKKNPNDNYLTHDFIINDVCYSVKRKNMNIFGPIARFLTKVIQTPNKNFKVSKDYIEGDDCSQNFINGDLTEELVYEMHKPKNVKMVAREILDILTEEVDNALS